VSRDPIQRAEVAVAWPLPGPTGIDAVIEQHFCRGCTPPGPIADVVCVHWGDGPRSGR
jgi:hypothetical protein